MLTDPATAVRKLLALGWRQSEIARASGALQATISGLATGNSDSKRIAWPLAVALDELYRRNRNKPARRELTPAKLRRLRPGEAAEAQASG